MLNKASLEKVSCDGLLVSSFSLAPDTVASLAETFDMAFNWIEQVPLGGASGVVGLRRAARAIECGDADVIACIGGDTYIPSQFSALLGRFTNATIDGVTPYGSGGANLQFAMLTQHYMDTYQVTREDIGRLCILQRENAMLYQQSLLSKSLTIDAYLNARPIADPLALFDCVMPCAGAEGVLVMSEEKAIELALPYALLCASAERHNASRELSGIPLTFGWDSFIDELYLAAQIDPTEIDLAQVYDDYPVMALIQLEELKLCNAGEATRHISSNGFVPAKRKIHINTSGGQLSSGQAGFAGGFMGLTEAVRQLTDAALGNQISDVKNAIVSGFGMINYDRGLCTAAAIIKRL